MPIPQRFPIPANDDDFEQMCLRLLREHWSRPGLELFGKRGERQFGIDILDVGGEIPIFTAQCKLKEEHKSLPPAEIQDEVDKAKLFTPPLGKYGILTTGKVSTQAQRRVREINQAHLAANLFEVEVLTWERICSLFQQYTEIQEQFYGEIGLASTKRIENQILSMKDGLESLTSRVEGDVIDEQINAVRDSINNRDFQLATLLLNLLERTKGDRLTARQRFRVISNRGAAELGMGRPRVAAKHFQEAVTWQPDDERAATNEVFAYLLVGDLPASHAKGSLLRRKFPGSSRLAALWLASAPRDIPLRTLEGDIDSILREDPEVSVALGRKALLERDFDTAHAYAGSSAAAAPSWSQPQLLFAQVSLARAWNIHPGFQGQSNLREALLRDAEAACSRASILHVMSETRRRKKSPSFTASISDSY
jgi:hypothetical protein